MMRQPDWDIDRVRGEEAETVVRELRSALLVGELEVKRDDRAMDTGNVYVEFWCQTAQGWMPSGIQTTKATTWVWVLAAGTVVVAQPVWQLKLIAEQFGRERVCNNGSHPTKGRVIPLAELLARAIYVMKRDEPRAA